MPHALQQKRPGKYGFQVLYQGEMPREFALAIAIVEENKRLVIKREV